MKHLPTAELRNLHEDLGLVGQSEALAATRHLETLPLPSAARAEYRRLLARREQSRDGEALALIARASELYDDLGDLERMAACRLEQGSMLLGELEAQAAQPAFEEAVEAEAAQALDDNETAALLLAQGWRAHLGARPGGQLR